MSTAESTRQSDGGLELRDIVSRNIDAAEQFSDHIATESPIAISYNGAAYAVMMASPAALRDFALGFSITEGVIDNPGQMLEIEVRQLAQGYALLLRIPTENQQRLKTRQRAMSGRAGCGICGLSEIAAAVPDLPTLAPRQAPSHIAIETAKAKFAEQQTLQNVCGGVHGAALCSAQGEIKLLREDVGRHNALDKLIGASLKSDFIAVDDFVFMSSRASHELVQKCVLAGLHSLVTISAASSLAIDTAQRSRLNLIGFIRQGRQLIYAENA